MEMQGEMTRRRDGKRSEDIAENRKEEARREVPEDFAKFEIESSLKEDQHEGQRAEAVNHAAKSVGIHPMEHRPDKNTGSHQNDYVRNAREAHEPIGEKRQHQQCSEKGKEKSEVHEFDVVRAV